MVVAVDKLQNKLKNALSGWKQLVILGIGNELGSDDSVGLWAVPRLKEALSGIPRVEVLAAGTVPENFTGLLRRLSPSHILLVDAAEVGEKPGTIELIEAPKIGEVMPSTHTPSLKMLVEYLQQELGSKVVILGIQPKELSFGTTLSEEVKNSVCKFVQLLKQIIASPPLSPRQEKEMGNKPIHERGKSDERCFSYF